MISPDPSHSDDRDVAHEREPRQKLALSELALLGGQPAFSHPRGTSTLGRPDFSSFLGYSTIFFDAHRYTNAGPLSILLEDRLAAFHDVGEAVVFSSGFWGLVLAIKCLALPGRTEVVMPSFTYRRMADAVAWTGLIPTFCEVDVTSLALTPDTAAPLISDATALILAPHPIVNCCDAPSLVAFAIERNLPILFDSVESVYETYGGQRIGTFGDAELFSMHASKLINAMEGGYVTTNDSALARRLRIIRGFAYDGQDNVVELGLNAKLNEVHAAMALAQLDDLDSQINHHRGVYYAYKRDLLNVPGIRLLEFDETEQCSYKNVVAQIDDAWPLPRELTLSLLNAEGVAARAYYSPPLHTVDVGYATRSSRMPLTEWLAERFISLPCGYQTSINDVHDIVQLFGFLAENAEPIKALAASLSP